MKTKRELRNVGRVRRRLVLEGRSAVYHVMSRVVRRQFWLEEAGREAYVRMIHRQAAFTGVEVLSYCLMGNHFHLLIRVPECPLKETGEHLISDEVLLARYEAYYGERTPLSAWTVDELRDLLEGSDLAAAEEARQRVLARMGNLSAFMQELKQQFTLWFNDAYESAGTIWSARFKSVLVEDTLEVLTKVAAYIDLNPVRARMVNNPSKYRWSSFGAAMAGCVRARSCMRQLYGGRAIDYHRAVAAYRLVVYGVGVNGKEREGAFVGSVDPDVVRKVLEAGGTVSWSEAFCCRIRYFSDGLILGSGSFVDACCAANADLFGKTKEKRRTLLPGKQWGGLASARNLQKNRFG